MDSHSEPSEPFRRPHNWTALHALDSFTSPSTSTSSSLGALATLSSSGDIPIFLHTPRVRNSVVSHWIARPVSETFLKPSTSTTTFQSTNTFGVSHTSGSHVKDDDVPTSDDTSDRTARQSFLLTPSPGPSHLQDERRRSEGYWSNRFSTVSDFSPYTVSAFLDSCLVSSDPLASRYDSDIPRASPSVPFSVCSSDSMIISPAESIVISPAGDAPYPSETVLAASQSPPVPESSNSRKLIQAVSSRSLSTISSASFARLSIIPSVASASTVLSEDFTITPTTRFHSPLLRNTYRPQSSFIHSEIVSPALRSPSPQLQPQPPALKSSCVSAPISRASPSPCTDTVSGLLPVVNLPRRSDSSKTPSSGSGSRHPRPHCPTRAVADLPGVLSWLHDTRIELWIDQEGFRAIRPKFALVGYERPCLSPSLFAANELADALTYGVAIFRPRRRETSTYHYGALDTTPTLRRLTLADSEDKDYISRQASLTIKANGVYAVTSTEAFDDHPLAHVSALNLLHLGSDPDHSHPNQLQLQWRFEYVVEDRKSDTGRVIAGEKTLTPLSFSCSPGLLHPSHGKRIRLMHVLMKTIAPKLSAARLATQQPVRIVGQGEFRDECALSPPDTQENGVLPSHRRTRSSESSTAPWVSGEPDKSECAKRVRPSSTPRQAVPQDHHADSREAHHDLPRISRQILSREELEVILASFSGPSEPATAAASPAGGLSPPSYYRHRRAQSAMQPVNELGMLR